eukprot:EST45161.1 Translational activator GCN1 [Spironucleus salmonicida]
MSTAYMKLLQASSDITIVKYLQENYNNIKISDFIKCMSFIKYVKNLKAVPKIENKDDEVIQAFTSLGSQYYYLASTQSILIQQHIGANSFEYFGTKLKNQELVNKLQHVSLQTPLPKDLLFSIQKRKPTLFQQISVQIINQCQLKINDQILVLVAPFVQYSQPNYKFLMLHTEFYIETLLLSFVGQLGKDDMENKLNILDQLKGVIVQNALHKDLVYNKAALLMKLPKFSQFQNKIQQQLQQIYQISLDTSSDSTEQIYEKSKSSVTILDFVNLQESIAYNQLLVTLDSNFIDATIDIYIKCIHKTELLDYTVLHFLKSSYADEKILKYILESSQWDLFKFLCFSDSNCLTVQFIRIINNIEVDMLVFKSNLSSFKQIILLDIKNMQIYNIVQRILKLGDYQDFIVQQLNLIENKLFQFTSIELQILNSNEIIQSNIIPSEVLLTKNADLKQEQHAKVSNARRLEIMQQLTQEEDKKRQLIKVQYVTLFDSLIELSNLLKRNTFVFRSCSHIFLSFILKISKLLGISLGIDKHVLQVVSVYLSIARNKVFVSGIESQPLLVHLAMKYIYGDHYKVKSNLKYKFQSGSYFIPYSNSNSLQSLITQVLNLYEYNPFDEETFQQVCCIISFLVPSLDQMQKIILTKYLNQSYEILSKIINNVHDFQILELIFCITDTNQYTLMRIVQNIISSYKLKGKQFDQHFMTPIINNLVTKPDHSKQLAYQTLSHIPTSQKINLTHDLQFKLLLSEYLGDSVRRFFLSSGDRINYINHLQNSIEELFIDCFSNYDAYRLELLPAAVQAICEQISTKQFIQNVVNKLLLCHFQYSTDLESSRFDIQTQNSSIRRCIWNIFDKIAKQIMSFDGIIDQSLPLGLFAPSYSQNFPSISEISPSQEEDELKNRIQIINNPISSNLFMVQESIYTQDSVISMLKHHQKLYIEIDPTKTTLMMAIVERFLHNGIAEYDQLVLQSAQQSIISLIVQMGLLYNQQIVYLLETNRQDQVANVKLNTLIYYFVSRFIKFQIGIFNFGVVHQYTIDNSQLANKETDMASYIVNILGSIATQLLFEDKERGVIINFLEVCSQKTLLDIDDKLAKALQNVWKNILTCQFVKQPQKQVYPHQKYKSGQEFAHNYLLHRYIDTVKFQSNEFPGSVFCLSGVIQFLGLSYVYQRENIIENVGCYCLRQAEDNKQQLGIVIIQSLIKAFGKLIEPYYILFIQDILYLSSAECQKTNQMVVQLQNILLKNLSLFGISCVMNVLVNALTNDVDWQFKKGACDLVYNLSSNSAKIPLQQFRLLMARMLPILLPALQPNIYHSHLQVKNSALKTIEKVADSVQSSQVKLISRKIIDAYSQPLLNRQILIEITQMTFTQQIDAASLTLIYPICDRVLSAVSSTIYQQSNDLMKDKHTKVIGCSCIVLLSKIAKSNDFKQYIPRLIQLLKDNLQESNDEIRTSSANTISQMLENFPLQAQSLEIDLWKNIAKPLDLQRQHGLALSIVNLSFNNQTWEVLLSRLNKVFTSQFKIKQSIEDVKEMHCIEYNEVNAFCASLFLLYLPQKLIELDDVALRNIFVSKYLQICFEFIFLLVRQPEFIDQSETLYKMARQLATSFLKHKVEIKQILDIVIQQLLSTAVQSRFLSISLIGDIISELGATESQESNRQISSDLQELRAQLLQVSFQKDEKRDVKVFIPEQSLGNAMNLMGIDMYYKLMGNLFLARCDDTHGIRNASVSMWKLVTIKPVTTILGFLPYLFEQFQILLMQHYQNIKTDLNFKQLVCNGIKELMISLQAAQFQIFVDKIYDLVQFENNFEGVSDEQLITSMDLFSFIAKCDTNGTFIHDNIVNFIPRLLTESKNEIVINSAAQLLTSLNADVSQLLETLVNPQIVKLLSCTDDAQVQQIINSVLMITTTKPQLQSLFEFAFVKNPINDNTVKFFKGLFKQSSVISQNFELLIEYCTKAIQRDYKEIITTSDTISTTDSIIFVHKCQEILYNCLSEESIQLTIREDIYDKIEHDYFNSIQSTSTSQNVLGITLCQLLCQVFPEKAAQNHAFIISVLNIFFTNSNNKNYPAVIGLTLSTFYKLFTTIQQSNQPMAAFISLFITQFYQNIKRIIPMMDVHELFLSQNARICDLVKILCFVLPTAVQIDESTKNQALKSIVLISLLTLQSHSKQANLKTNFYEFDQLQFAISIDKNVSKLIFSFCTILIGRVVLTLKSDPSDAYRISLVDSIHHIFSICVLLGQLEPSIRIDVERRCLITKNKELQAISVTALFTLFQASLRQEQNIMSLISILFSQSRQMHQLDVQTVKALLKTLQLCLRDSDLKLKFAQKPNEIQISEENFYDFIAILIFEQIVLVHTDKELLLLASQVCAEAILAQSIENSVQTFTTLVLNPDGADYFGSQISVFCAVLSSGIQQQKAQKAVQIVKTATGSPFKFLEEKLDFCPNSALNSLAECLKAASWLVSAFESFADNSVNLALNTFSKLLSVLFERYGDCNLETRKCALNAFYNFENVENREIRINIGVVSMDMLQKMLLDQEVGFDAQYAVIEFYRLRIGSMEFDDVYSVIVKGDKAVAVDMKHRIEQMLKQIKTGKI